MNTHTCTDRHLRCRTYALCNATSSTRVASLMYTDTQASSPQALMRGYPRISRGVRRPHCEVLILLSIRTEQPSELTWEQSRPWMACISTKMRVAGPFGNVLSPRHRRNLLASRPVYGRGTYSKSSCVPCRRLVRDVAWFVKNRTRSV